MKALSSVYHSDVRAATLEGTNKHLKHNTKLVSNCSLHLPPFFQHYSEFQLIPTAAPLSLVAYALKDKRSAPTIMFDPIYTFQILFTWASSIPKNTRHKPCSHPPWMHLCSTSITNQCYSTPLHSQPIAKEKQSALHWKATKDVDLSQLTADYISWALGCVYLNCPPSCLRALELVPAYMKSNRKVIQPNTQH